MASDQSQVTAEVLSTVVPPLKVVFEEADRKAILEEIDKCLSSGWVAAGKYVKEFEEFWADYCGCTHAVACGSGGAALEMLMKALGVEGKEVLVPTNTFVASPNSIIFAGGNAVFLDTDPRTMGVSLEEIKRQVTDNTVGVMVVHIGGIISPEMSQIASWCKEKGIWLVEDAAHAHGSESEGMRAGQFGTAAAYSFFATKVMTGGEGGMVVTDDDDLAETCRRLRDYGKRTDWETVHTYLSSNYRMNEISAIVGLSQARRLDDFIAWRQKIADRYTEELADVLELVLPPGRNSWYKYMAYLPQGMDREHFRTQMKERGVSLSGGVYDIPVHLQPVYQELRPGLSLPQSEAACARHICLPLFYTMTDEQADHVIASVRDLLQASRS